MNARSKRGTHFSSLATARSMTMAHDVVTTWSNHLRRQQGMKSQVTLLLNYGDGLAYINPIKS